jgi:hypothetical protein
LSVVVGLAPPGRVSIALLIRKSKARKEVLGLSLQA